MWGREGSSLRPRDYESPALPTELLPRTGHAPPAGKGIRPVGDCWGPRSDDIGGHPLRRVAIRLPSRSFSRHRSARLDRSPQRARDPPKRQCRRCEEPPWREVPPHCRCPCHHTWHGLALPWSQSYGSEGGGNCGATRKMTIQFSLSVLHIG